MTLKFELYNMLITKIIRNYKHGARIEYQNVFLTTSPPHT